MGRVLPRGYGNVIGVTTGSNDARETEALDKSGLAMNRGLHACELLENLIIVTKIDRNHIYNIIKSPCTK